MPPFPRPTIHNTRTTIDAVIMRGLEHAELQIYVSYFRYHKPIVTCLSLKRDVPFFLNERKDLFIFL